MTLALLLPSHTAAAGSAVHAFDLSTPGGRVRCAFAGCAAPLGELEPGNVHFLSEREANRLPAMTSQRRRTGFLRGRRAAKDALGLACRRSAAGIHIEPGTFGQPVVEGVAGLGVSLSHSDDLAVALAFPLTHPLGIDIEQVRPRNENALRSQLTGREIDRFVAPAADPLAIMTALWCIKEALSKLLGGGLAIEASVMEVRELREEGGLLHARFVNIAHVAARACLNADMAMAVTMPHDGGLDMAALFRAATACAGGPR
jgi:4'-phosphopantetheinyl transferase